MLAVNYRCRASYRADVKLISEKFTSGKSFYPYSTLY